MKRRPLPSAGSIGPVPPLHRYYEALRLPAARFAALRCLRLAIPPVRPVCSQRPGRTTVGSGELLFRVPSRKLSVETAGSLRFPSDPRVPTPCSQTPVGPMHARPLRRLGAAPASLHNGGSRNKDDFGAQSHGIRTRCLSLKIQGQFFDFFRGCWRPLWTTRSLTIWIASIGLIRCPLIPAYLRGSRVSQGRSGTEPIG